MRLDGCLPADTIDALLSGKLDDAAVERAEAHLETCDSCRAVVSQLARDSVYDLDAAAAAASTEVPAGAMSETVSERGSRSRPHALRLRRIDRYVVERKLGSGGMGVVFLAADPELGRKVVIKLLRPELTEPGLEGRARLLREAQAMAKVSHPNVVPIYDVGVHDDQVFLAMEFIDGVDLAKWLDVPRSRSDVLAVLVAAGRGLAAAHRAGLVHRDFKPSNVMVGASGDVKVTDFGLARAGLPAPSDDPRAERDAPAATRAAAAATLLESPITHAGAVVGTPAYMAPEQILGELVDPRSDQFSFCVALYEALYGKRPFGGTSTAELFESTLEGKVPPEPRAGRGIPRRVRDAIRRGLAVEPAARFPSMDALLAVLEPPASRRWVVAFAVAGLASVGLGAALFARHDHRVAPCTGDAAELAVVWSSDRRNAIEAAFIATKSPMARPAFATIAAAIDRYGATWRAGHRDACEATRVRGDQTEAILNERMRCLRRRRAELDALLEILARPDDAILASPDALLSRLPSPLACSNVDTLADATMLDDPKLRPELDAIETELARATAELAAGHNATARVSMGAILSRAQKLAYKPFVAEIDLELAMLAEADGAWQQADQHLQDAIEVAEQAGDDRTRATAYLHLIEVATTTKRDDAERWIRQARATIARLGQDPRLLAELDAKVAALQRARRDDVAAEATLKDRIAHAIAGYGAASIEVAEAELALAVLYNATRDHERAYQQFARARDTFARAVGPDSPLVASTTGAMAFQRFSQGKWQEAVTVGEEALAKQRAFYGGDHPLVLAAESQHALALQGAGRQEDGLALMKHVVETTAKVHGDHHPQYAEALLALGAFQFKATRYDDAFDAFDRALAIFRATYGDDHGNVAAVLEGMGVVRQRQGRLDDALALLERGRAILVKVEQPGSVEIADALTRLGSVEVDRRHPSEAEKLLDDALAMRVASHGDQGSLGWTQRELARAIWDVGRDRSRALSIAREAEANAQAAQDQEQLDKVRAWLASHPL